MSYSVFYFFLRDCTLPWMDNQQSFLEVWREISVAEYDFKDAMGVS